MEIKANALIIIDPQNDFVKGSLAVPGAEEAMNNIIKFIEDHKQDLGYIGDADGYTTYDFTCESTEEIEEAIKYISILNKLKPLKDHWGICFDDFYIKDYPGEYIGLSEDEYNIFKSLICPNNFEDVREKISECLRSETEYSFLVFEKVDVYYYDENGIKYNVEWD